MFCKFIVQIIFAIILINLSTSVYSLQQLNQSKNLRNTHATNAIKPSNSNNEKSKPKPKPWEILRFVKIASFYDGLIPRLPFLPSRLSKERICLSPGSNLWPSNKKGDFQLQWGPLDDVVMGGVSKSDLEPGEPFDGKWTGLVTSANNGGFAGIRTKLFKKPFDLSSCKGLFIKFKGDGNRYKFIARDDEDWNGVAWSLSFDTLKNRSQEVKVPFDQLKPTRFAKTLSNKQKYNKGQITALQISLSKFEYDGGLNPNFKEGPFSFELESIKSY